MMHAPLSAVAQEWLRTKEALLAAHPELADDPAMLIDILDGETRALDIVDALVLGALEDEGHASAVSDLRKTMADRQERLETRATKRREAACALLLAMGEKGAKRAAYGASIGFTKPKLGDVNPEALPERFFDYRRVVNNARVKEALEAGLEVPGARLTQGGEPYLRVTTK